MDVIWVIEDHQALRGHITLGEADLLPLQGGVVEGGDDDELVAFPLGGLAELDVERLSGGGYHGAVGQVALVRTGARFERGRLLERDEQAQAPAELAV
jgi:hypothetical protein